MRFVLITVTETYSLPLDHFKDQLRITSDDDRPGIGAIIIED